MAHLHLDPASLTVHFGTAEKILGLVRDLEVPLSAVRSVAVEADGVRATRGLRAPGLALPGLRKIGTWRSRGHRALVCVRRDQPALLITLAGHRYSELLIGADDAEGIAESLRAGLGNS